MPTPPPLVIFDRDDTLIYCDSVTEHGDLGDPALVEPLPGAVDAVRRLKSAGVLVGVATNQGGVARGRYTEADVEAVLARVNELFGGGIDASRYCPFHPDGTVPKYTREHPWRKPNPGMLVDIAAELLPEEADRSGWWMLGDKVRDCEAGRAAGMRTVLIDPPGLTRSSGHPERAHPSVDVWTPTVGAAVDVILGCGRGGTR